MDQVVITLRGQVKDDIIHDTIHKQIKAKGQSIYADKDSQESMFMPAAQLKNNLLRWNMTKKTDRL